MLNLKIKIPAQTQNTGSSKAFIYIHLYIQSYKANYKTHPPLIHKLQMQAVQTQFHKKKKTWVLYLKDQYDFISGVHPSGRKSIFVINFVSVCRRYTFKQAHTDTHTHSYSRV